MISFQDWERVGKQGDKSGRQGSSSSGSEGSGHDGRHGWFFKGAAAAKVAITNEDKTRP